MLENANNFDGGRLAPAAVGLENALTLAPLGSVTNDSVAPLA